MLRRQEGQQRRPLTNRPAASSGRITCPLAAPAAGSPSAQDSTTGAAPKHQEQRPQPPAPRSRLARRLLLSALAGLLLLQIVPSTRLRAPDGGPIWSLARAEAADATGESAAHTAGRQPMDPSFLVDTKYWIKNMDFGERDNWRAGRRPCTLDERVAIQEQAAVVSLGEPMEAPGGFGQAIRELNLAQDGVLLLEEDTPAADPLDPLFVEFLNESADCYDSSRDGDRTRLDHDESSSASADVAAAAAASKAAFLFEPHPDSMSWFNPANWRSELHEQMHSQLFPDSHRIPCPEDVVVFGSRGPDERAKVLAFKVNFRPAGGAGHLSQGGLTSPLRVSRLKIDERSYTQAELDALNGLYDDQLFDFRDTRSAFSEQLRPDGRQDMLLIDESSIQPDAEDSLELCHEEAGCLCGNERADIMEIICSFNYPIHPDSLPCRDPIPVAGYCNKICATSLVIGMDPSKFREGLLSNTMNQVNESLPAGYLSSPVFVALRRIEHNKYEIVLRMEVTDDESYYQSVGREAELAQRIKQVLEKAATKSFYGIKSISIRSSTDWRRNNRSSIMWATFIISSSIFILLFVYNDEIFSIEPLTSASRFIGRQFLAKFSIINANSDDRRLSRNGSFSSSPILIDQDAPASGPSTRETLNVDLALVSIDTRPIAGTDS